MARWKNIDWNIGGRETEEFHNPQTTEQTQLAVLMDLRDELRLLNRVFACSAVQRGFAALRQLARFNELAFKRRVEAARRKRASRKARNAGAGK